jgi:selenoprotein W-related protein
LAAEIRDRYPNADVQLNRASGGLFEVAVDGELVFSKRQLGRHAEAGEVVELIEKLKG